MPGSSSRIARFRLSFLLASVGYTGRMATAIDIEKLDTEQRLELIEALWESLGPNPDAIPVSEDQQEELDRRLDRMKSDDGAGIAWDVVREKIRDRLE